LSACSRDASEVNDDTVDKLFDGGGLSWSNRLRERPTHAELRTTSTNAGLTRLNAARGVTVSARHDCEIESHLLTIDESNLRVLH
jgi:hypothetical protein